MTAMLGWLHDNAAAHLGALLRVLGEPYRVEAAAGGHALWRERELRGGTFLGRPVPFVRLRVQDAPRPLQVLLLFDNTEAQRDLLRRSEVRTILLSDRSVFRSGAAYLHCRDFAELVASLAILEVLQRGRIPEDSPQLLAQQLADLGALLRRSDGQPDPAACRTRYNKWYDSYVGTEGPSSAVYRGPSRFQMSSTTTQESGAPTLDLEIELPEAKEIPALPKVGGGARGERSDHKNERFASGYRPGRAPYEYLPTLERQSASLEQALTEFVYQEPALP